MVSERICDAAVIAGRMSKANEFVTGAGRLEGDLPNAAGDLYVDAGIAASDVICCIRLGVHSSSSDHYAAVALLKQAENGSEKNLNTLLNLKNKAAYSHQELTAADLKKMNRAAEHLVESARRAVASGR